MNSVIGRPWTGLNTISLHISLHPSHMLHISQTPRVNPQDNLALKEKMWWAYLKIWIPEASVCPASARPQTAGSRRWTFTEKEAVSFCCCLFSRLGCSPELRSLKARGFLIFSPFHFFTFFSAKINNIPFPSWGWFIKAIELESASSLLLIAWVKDIWSWSMCAYSQHCKILKCICLC